MEAKTLRISQAPCVFLLSILVGGLLSLIVGLRNDEFTLLSPLIIFLDSFILGAAIWISLHVTQYIVPQEAKGVVVYLLSFGIMLGAGILSALVIFLLSPTSFFFSDNQVIVYLLLNLLFFITVNIIVNGHFLFLKRAREHEKALNEERLLKSQMELKLLASKLNPHFLFNSMSLVLSLLKKPTQAEKALINLSELLRFQLELGDQPQVPIEEEMDAVQKYLAIQKLRFGDKLTYEIIGQAKGSIPPLLIQPLVENSIKHNIDYYEELHIDVQLAQEENKLVIGVVDSARLLKPEMLAKGLGLSVTAKRVALLGGEFTFKEGGVEITFPS